MILTTATRPTYSASTLAAVRTNAAPASLRVAVDANFFLLHDHLLVVVKPLATRAASHGLIRGASDSPQRMMKIVLQLPGHDNKAFHFD